MEGGGDVSQQQGRRSGASSLLVVGAGRGGTSLTAALLDGHPEIEVAFELGSDLLVARDTSHPARQRAQSLRALCEGEATDSSARIWGNKLTTEQVAALVPIDGSSSVPLAPEIAATIAEFFVDVFRDWKVVFVLRSGPACIMSKVRRAGLAPTVAARRWILSVGCCQLLADSHPNLHVLHFEDLVTRPEVTLAAVCNFLDVEFDPIMLTATTSDKLLPEYRRVGIDVATAAPVEVPDEIVAGIGPAMQMAGYGTDGLRTAGGPPSTGVRR